jgi:hypothetical protein
MDEKWDERMINGRQEPAESWRTAEAELEVNFGDPVDERAPSAAAENQRRWPRKDFKLHWWLHYGPHLISQVTVSWCFM